MLWTTYYQQSFPALSLCQSGFIDAIHSYALFVAISGIPLASGHIVSFLDFDAKMGRACRLAALRLGPQPPSRPAAADDTLLLYFPA